MKTEASFGQLNFWGAFLNFLLLLLLSVSMFRFINHFITFSQESLQMDFSAYYTAGESLNHGLSPYKNFVHNQPPIWDGINRYKYSRFLYPPLVASFFQPIATLPYHVAKWIWGGLELMAVIATFMIVESFFPAISFRRILLVCILTLWYFPLLTHLERGQIDVFTLFLITLAINFIIKRDKLGDLLSGVLLAFAALLKLYVIFFLPFIFLQKRLRILYGFGLGTALILILTIVFQRDATHLFDYVYNHLPRMANIGDIARSDTLVNTKPIRAVLDQTPPGFDTLKDGHGYSLGAFNFVTNATLVEPLRDELTAWGVTSRAGISMGLYGLFFAMVIFWNRRSVPDNFSVIEEYLYWQIPAVITLLVSPITWTMNMVWLLPLFSVSIYLLSTQVPVSRKIPVMLISLALLIAMLPDVINTPSLSFAGFILGEYKYIYSEILALLGLFLFLGKKRGTAQKCR
jgi:hypothetical protein